MEHWTSALDEITHESIALFGSLTREKLNWKPDASTWSIGQNLDHLMVVNETYFPILANIKADNYPKPFMARLGFMVSFLGKTVLTAVQPDRRKRMKTFPIWEPQNDRVEDDILQRFEAHQHLLKQKMQEVKVFVGQGIVIASPANKHVVYPLETAFDIIVSHELRHLEQAKEVLALMYQHAR